MALQGQHMLAGDGMRGFVAEFRQRGIFQPLAQAHQARQAQPREIFSQTVDGYRKFDELLETTVCHVMFPTGTQYV